MNIDPVSGNEVPPGASPEEVRDDIPINASEGEYVLPANVVRFLGLEKIEKMVAKAQEQLEQMDMGGELPEEEDLIPQDTVEGPVEGAAPGMAEGGMVTDNSSASFSGSKEYRNASGQVMFIPFIGGQPLFDIPDGYSESSVSDAETPLNRGARGSLAAPTTPQRFMDSEATNESRASDRERASPLAGDPRDWTPSDYINYAEGKGNPASQAVKGIVSMLPFGLLAMKAQDKWKAPIIADSLDTMVETGMDLQGNPIPEEQLNTLRSTREDLKNDLSERSGLNLNPVESLGRVFNSVSNFLSTGSFKPTENNPVGRAPVDPNYQPDRSVSGTGAPRSDLKRGSVMSQDSSSGGGTVSQPRNTYSMGSDLGRDPSSGPSTDSMSTGGMYYQGGLITKRKKK